jgi:hypothetical protein
MTMAFDAPYENGPSPALLRTHGILIDRPHLPRTEAVSEIIDLAKREQFVVLSSPPATGKTALLQLVQHTLYHNEGATVKLLPLTAYSTVEDIKTELDLLGISPWADPTETIDENTWILLDDAQNWYSRDYWPFWQFLIQNLPLESFGRCFVVVATTHDLFDLASPVKFASLPHFSKRRLSISEHEADELCILYAGSRESTKKLFRHLKRLSRVCGEEDEYHIGVIVQGLLLLREESRRDESVLELRYGDIVTFMGRCFVLPGGDDDLPEEGRTKVVETMLHPCKGSIADEPLLVPYLRAGILAPSGTFSCLAARWFYNKHCFQRRPHFQPPSIEELVRLAVASLSASQLVQHHSHEKGFPRKEVFAQLLNESLSMHLPASTFLIPELNPPQVDSFGNEVSHELEFHIEGKVPWCFYLLVNGPNVDDDLIKCYCELTGNQHRDGLDEEEDEEEEDDDDDEPRQYLIVYCRPPENKGRGVPPYPNLCTLCFEDIYSKCRIQMRTEKEEIVSLQP